MILSLLFYERRVIKDAPRGKKRTRENRSTAPCRVLIKLYPLAAFCVSGWFRHQIYTCELQQFRRIHSLVGNGKLVSARAKRFANCRKHWEVKGKRTNARFRFARGISFSLDDTTTLSYIASLKMLYWGCVRKSHVYPDVNIWRHLTRSDEFLILSRSPALSTWKTTSGKIIAVDNRASWQSGNKNCILY